MANLITADELRPAISQQLFIKGGDANNAEVIKYDFRLSNHILKAKFGRPIDASKLSLTEATELVVEPGEVVFALSEERLALPMDMIAQLSPKRKMSQAGILTLGGLTIDPGYSGPLLVGLLNISSTPFILQPGRKLVGAIFFRLTDKEKQGVKGSAESMETFPDELVEVMQKYRPIGTKFLTESLERLQKELNSIKQDLHARDEWKQILERHDNQIENLIRGLEAETVARKDGEDRFSKSIEKLNSTFLMIKGGAIALWALLAILLIPFLIQWLPKIVKPLLGGPGS